jgi:tubby-related protein 1
MKGPRKMQCYVPGVTDNGELVKIRPKAKKDAIYPRWKKGDRTGLMKLINKPPKWSEEYQAFVLNFYGRVRLASVKNFQIVDEDRPDFIFLQFGKVNEHSFTMDFQWPFTPVQAMMICLSSFDFKWACE